MARINPVLDLNKTPQSVDNTSLVFAKNIKLSPNKDIVKDDTFIRILEYNPILETIVGKIVGINSKIYFFTHDINNNVIIDKIIEYDEITNTRKYIKSAWHYSGGQIHGCVTCNNTGEYILTVCEYNDVDNIPIKHINLSKCSETDDESIYTQTPNIPITNLYFENYYIEQIPTGVYQFFVRYKIRDNFYTNWFLASNELFTGYHEVTNTVQGGLTYINKHKDSNKSFILRVEHLNDCKDSFEGFQIGFILSTENSSVARRWKTFDFNTNIIYFDYDKNFIEEEDINEILKTPYELFNVKNISYYKNKEYISNYKETDFNEDLDIGNPKVSLRVKNIADIANVTETRLNGREVIKHGNYYDEIIIEDGITKSASYLYCNSLFSTIYRKNSKDGLQYLDKPFYEELENYLKNNENTSVNIYVGEIYVYDDSNQHCTIIPRNSFRGVNIFDSNDPTCIHVTSVDDFNSQIDDVVRNYIIGFNEINNNFFIRDINNNEINTDKFYYEVFWYGHYNNNYGIILETTNYLNTNVTKAYNGTEEQKTLLPFTRYDFYIHYLKSNGVYTNGYLIDSIKSFNPNISYNYEYELIGFIKGVTTHIDSNSNNIVYDISSTDKYVSVYNQFGRANVVPNKYIGLKANQNPLPAVTSNSAKYVASLIETIDGTYDVELWEKKEKDFGSLILYPSFENIVIPNGYIGYFISVYKHTNDFSQLFNVNKLTDTNGEITSFIADSIECDVLLYGISDKLTIKNQEGQLVTENAEYRHSGSTKPIASFGTAGYVYVPLEKNGDYEFKDTDTFYIVGKTNDVCNDKKELIKITPYIKKEDSDTQDYDNYEALNLPGFVCLVTKLNRIVADKYYISGTDVFEKTIDANDNENIIDYDDVYNLAISNTSYLKFIELKEFIPTQAAIFYNILSNYNLNYLSLTEDLQKQIRKYNIVKSDDEEVSDNQILISVNSLIASSIYELQSTFKDYSRKYYSILDKNKIIYFNNVVRSSDINADEIYKNIYEFNATDYYNVPTDRGIIVNLFSISNVIYVHCEHAIFKFSDNNNISTENNNITLQESNVFDTGIQNVFDDQYGFAGIFDKKHSLVTHNSYIFYDKLARKIYAYGGNTEIAPISDKIEKLLNWIDPTDVIFVADNKNNRFFINLRHFNTETNIYDNVCLSYSFLTKNFTSIHDIDFDDAFNSRINCYFENNKIIDEIITKCINRIDYNNTTPSIDYKDAYKISKYTIKDVDEYSEVSNVASCVDIICNNSYERIKVLNFINWICASIDSFFDNNVVNAAEEINSKYGGDKIRIYSDQCHTLLIDLVDDNHNSIQSNVSVNYYKYPRFDSGIWSLNYFRDVKNRKDLFNYNENVPLSNKRELYQEDSLLYGKYFVIRIIFKNKNFKLENVVFNMNNYEKV